VEEAGADGLLPVGRPLPARVPSPFHPIRRIRNAMIDLRSDTVTRPSAGMRRAMAEAEAGDDVLGDDPTAIRLEERAAELLGMPAALFVPSGTMANLIAIRSQTHHGEEVICNRDSHIVNYEVAGHAAVSGVQFQPLDADRGLLLPGQVSAAMRTPNIHHPIPRLVAIENTHNRGSGAVYPVDRVAAIADVAGRHGLAMHCDGARLMNACVALGVSASAYTRHLSSCTLCLSKGLGAPIGSVVAGSVELIETARRYRKMFGGGMRQVGIIAAAGLYAIEHNIERLAEDHANAKYLAGQLAGMPGIEIDPDEIETNLVIFRITREGLTAAELVAAMAAEGVAFFDTAPDKCRMVTHLDVSHDEVARAVDAMHHVLSS
jgi:threonine aldolase